MASIHGLHLLREVAKALGLEGHMVKRLVIDLSVEYSAKVYVEKFVEMEQVEGFLTSVKALRAAGRITVTEVPAGQCPDPRVVAGVSLGEVKSRP